MPYSIRSAAGLVVEVVKFADCCDPGSQHLAEHLGRKAAIRGWVEPIGYCVHLVSPGPEIATFTMRLPTKCAVENVRVRVYQTGEDDAAEPGCPGRVRGRAETGEASVLDMEDDVFGQ